MSSTAPPLEIKVVYRASSRGVRLQPRAARPQSASQSTAARRAVMGALNLAFAAMLFFAIWWPLENSLSTRATLISQIFPQEQVERINEQFGIKSDKSANSRREVRRGQPRPITGPAPAGDGSEKSARVSGTNGDDAKPIDGENAPRYFQGQDATKAIWGALIGWIVLSSGCVCLTTLATGAAWSPAFRNKRRIPGILTVGLFAFIAFAAYDTWVEYGVTYRVWMAKTGIALIAGLFFMLGLTFGRGGRGSVRFSGCACLLLGVGSAAGLYLWQLANALPVEIYPCISTNESPLLTIASANAVTMIFAALPFVLWGLVQMRFAPRRIS